MRQAAPIKIGVFGASGRMGQLLGALAGAQGWQAFWGGFKTRQPSGFCFTHVLSDDFYRGGVKTIPVLREIDIFFDFSVSEVVLPNVGLVRSLERPYVCGVTGLSVELEKGLRDAAQHIPVLWSPNFSLGINLMKRIIPHLAQLHDVYDFDIEEIHHRAKRDAPSGTALMLRQELRRHLPEEKKLNMPISLRGGGVVGEHCIIALGDYEILRFSHHAFDRKAFALGALYAGQWLLKQTAGWYSLDQVWEEGFKTTIGKFV
ncbi:MAG: 4-hydroxy-tetrahydrodipicolinate reductase [Bdellovibrionaceae bacterium]|nr:4-hydroxy-tetrahydrodipicolinate reductase [Pseudobdellovibrionaceae bacterium]MDW8189470.1 4-hydroxy-tetrahydrodipicolinate reductase [Pseudobdellovibrionaceae bacterium]